VYLWLTVLLEELSILSLPSITITSFGSSFLDGLLMQEPRLLKIHHQLNYHSYGSVRGNKTSYIIYISSHHFK